MSTQQYHTIVLPRHPDDAEIPDSILNIYLGPGKIVTIQAPLFSRSMEILHDALLLCRDSIISNPPDYEI